MLRFNLGFFNSENVQIYNDQLKVLVQSIWDVYKDTVKVAIFHSRFVHNTIKKIRNKFPFFYFKEKNIDIKFSSKILASRKMNLWYELYIDSEVKRNIFMDADMMILRKIDNFFNNSFDIAYTHKTVKEEVLKKPLNSALILVNKSKVVDKFMRYWRDRTNKLLNSKNCFGGGWGGSDQQVLGEILGTKDINRMRKTITVNKRKFKGLRFKGFPCQMLNNILSPSLNNDSGLDDNITK